MEIAEPTQKEAVTVEGGATNPMRKAHAAPDARPDQSGRASMPCASGTRLESLSDAWRSRCTRGRAEWKLQTWLQVEGDYRALEAHQIAEANGVMSI
jgi:hypothetical protein